MKQAELEQQIELAQNAYYNGEAVMEDAEYDALLEKLKKKDPEHRLVVKVGSPPVVSSPWKKAEHKIPMGSLNKVNTPDELKQWVEKTCPNQELFFVEKLDGISIELVYEQGKLTQAITRGDGTTGEEISANVSRMGGVIKQLPNTFTGSFRGEIILTHANHKEHFSDKANARNGASGVSKRLDGVGVQYLDVLLYQVLGDMTFETEQEQFEFLHQVGCSTPSYQTMKTPELVIEKWQEYQTSIRDSIPYDIDGIVVRVNDLAKQKALGSRDLRPKAAVAFKFENVAKETTVKGCVFQTGNTGRITGVALLEPVVLCGAVVERASLYNMAYINKLGIGIGAKVLVVRANEVIPRVETVIEKPTKIIEAPTHCPVCETAVIVNGEYLECPNYDCFARVSGRIKNWCDDLNILELGETLIDKLVENGLVEDVSDLYLLTVEELVGVERMGEKSASNVIQSIHSRNPVSLDVLLGALSIPMIGSITIRQLMGNGYDTLDRILELTQEQMQAVNGIGPSRAESLVRGLKMNKEMITMMIENGVQVKEMTVGKLTGKSFCFTGKAENKRDVLESLVVDNGGTVKLGVGAGLSFLVLADPNSSSAKAVKARKLGTTLISEDAFLAMVK